MATKKTTTAEAEEVAEVAETTQEVEEVTADTILAEARAEAARIIAEAQAKAEPTEEAAVAEAEAKPKAKKKKETVPIRLFKDSEKYSDDVFVAVNGKRVMIKRGETVQVEKKFFKVLEQSADQDTATADLIQRESSSYETEAKRRGL